MIRFFILLSYTRIITISVSDLQCYSFREFIHDEFRSRHLHGGVNGLAPRTLSPVAAGGNPTLPQPLPLCTESTGSEQGLGLSAISIALLRSIGDPQLLGSRA
jgi:hypothetical protein